jgi:cyclohexanone monooxygenase
MARARTKAAIDPNALHLKYLKERDKRLRADADRQFIAAEGDFARFADDPYVTTRIERAPRFDEVDTLIVGAGFGGLLTAARLIGNGVNDFLIVEPGGDFGGTWYWNRYPGLRCDIESYVYMPLLEELGVVPTQRYVSGSEIFRHAQAIGRHYRLYERALLQTKVNSMRWDEDASRWLVETDRGDKIAARFVSISQGPLAKVKLPGIPGIRKFRGKMFHASRWDYSYTGGDENGGLTKLAKKRVAVIGTGATGVQIVPRLAESAREVYVFQRTPSALDERNNAPTDAAWFAAQRPGWLKRRRDNFLAVITMAPHIENVVGDRWTDFWERFGGAMKAARAAGGRFDPHEIMQSVDYAKMEELRARVDAIVEDRKAAEALKPWYNYLCKRPLYSDDYLQAFNRKNVKLIDTDGKGVEEIGEYTLTANGKSYEVDCVIFATGFDVGAPPHKVGDYQVVGRGGVTLEQKWSRGLRTVHGTQMHGFPNFHIVGGTAQGTTAFNFTHTLDMQAIHAAALIARGLSGDISSVEVTAEAEERWLAALEAKHVDHQHFYEECTPGFLNNEGEFKDRPTFVGDTYGGGPLEYERLLAEWRNGGGASDIVVTRGAATPQKRAANA